eukprot:g5013.t1
MDAEDMALVDEHLSQGGFLTLLEEDGDGNFVEAASSASRSGVAPTRVEDQDPAWMCPFVPSSARRIDRLLDKICPVLNASDAVYDLGCGDGRMLIALSRRCACACVGVDIDPQLIATARAAEQQAAIAAETEPLHENAVTWLCQDICGMALDDPRATVAVIYLVPSALKLIQTWIRELWSSRDDLTLVLFVYAFEGWAPDEVDKDYGISVYHCRDPTRRQRFSFAKQGNDPGTASAKVGEGEVSIVSRHDAISAIGSSCDSEDSDDEDGQPPAGVIVQALFDDSSCESESEESEPETPDSSPVLKKGLSWRQTGLRGALAGRPRNDQGHENETDEESKHKTGPTSTVMMEPTGTTPSDTTHAVQSKIKSFLDSNEDVKKGDLYPIADPQYAIQKSDDELSESSPLPLWCCDTLNTADSTEFCPIPGFESVCAVATYELKNSTRLGTLSIVDTNNLCDDVLTPVWEGSGVLDCKWAATPVAMSDGSSDPAPLLAAVHANGTMTMHRLERHSSAESEHSSTDAAPISSTRYALTEACAAVGTDGGPMFLSLEFDDRHERCRGGPLSVVVSQWDGRVGVWDVTATDRARSDSCRDDGIRGVAGGPRCVRLWDAHELPGGNVAEAWIAAFDCWHPKTVLTGGDDGALYGWDLRAPGHQVSTSNVSPSDVPPSKIFTRRYDAGVCSIQFDVFREHRVAVGGYFGAVEILDMRALSSAGGFATAMVSPLNRWETGGGVWRLKWHPSSVGLLAGACMRGGIRVFRDPTGHPGEALAYGEEAMASYRRLLLPLFQLFAYAAGFFQIVLVVLYGMMTEYGPGPDPSSLNNSEIDQYYPFYQDVHVMIFIGFGFLMTFLKKYGFSSVGYNFLISCLAIQWAMVCNGLLHDPIVKGKSGLPIKLGITDLITGDFAAGAVLISFGAVLGKTSPLQMLLVVFFELIFYAVNESIGAGILSAVDMGGSIFVHTFGAYFGIAMSWVITRSKFDKATKDETGHPKNGSDKTSDMFAMIGTVFLWMFWPSFNGALATEDQQYRVVINT